MSPLLSHNSYGQSDVRLLKISRRSTRHEVADVTVGVRLEGDYDRAHTAGDNRAVLPAQAVRDAVYAMARRRAVRQIEEFGVRLAEHFLGGDAGSAVSRVRVELAERAWERVGVGGRPHDTTFRGSGGHRRLAVITATGEGADVESGVEHLVLLKTAGAAYQGFARDAYTTLRDAPDRVLAAVVSARWRYVNPDASYGLLYEKVVRTLLESFAEHESRSVQHTLYTMGEAVLEYSPEVAEVRLAAAGGIAPLADPTTPDIDAPNELFLPTDAPHDLTEATVRREGMAGELRLLKRGEGRRGSE